jgi:hypothetical protein
VIQLLAVSEALTAVGISVSGLIRPERGCVRV